MRVICFLVVICCTVLTRASYDKYLEVMDHGELLHGWNGNHNLQIRATLEIPITSIVNQVQDLIDVKANRLVSTQDMVDKLKAETESLALKMSSLPTDYVQGAIAYEAPIAFQAYVSIVDAAITTVDGQSLSFSDVTLNDGDHYNSVNGLFTAPEDGLYYFFTTLTRGVWETGKTYMRKISTDGTVTDIAYCKYYVDQETAATAVTELKTGDTVGIYPANGFSTIWNRPEGEGNTFGGYMIARNAQ